MWMRKEANTISGQNAGRSLPGRFAALLAIAAFAWASLTAPVAMAYDRGIAPSGYGVSSNYANSQDALLTPCFGMLIYPSVRHCRPYHGYGYGYGYGHYSSSVNVDCNTDSYRLVIDKIRRVRPGGAVYFSGSKCKVSITVNASIALIGKPSKNGAYPVLEAMDSQPCLRVGPRADKVLVRNLTLISSRGQRTACIEASGRELSIVDSNLRYDGEDAAIRVDAGRFNLYNTNVVARTLTSAVEIDRASFYSENSRIASTYNGIKGNIVDDSRIVGLTFMQLGDWQGFVRGEGAKAVDLKLLTSGSVLTADQLKILFYGNGLYLSGAGEALVSNSLFYSDHAITSSLDRVRILNNYIFADEIGISIDDGEAFVGNNHIQLVRTAGIVAKTDAMLKAVNNHIMTLDCQALRDGGLQRAAPEDRTCTPWFKNAAFGIPGGGVDWSLNALLEEACVQDPNDSRATDVCERYRRGASKLAAKPGNIEDYDQIMDRGCATTVRPGTPLDMECRAHRERSQRLKTLTADSKVSKDELSDARDDYDRQSLESIKRLCFSTTGTRPKEWSGQDMCSSVKLTMSADAEDPHEDDETNMELAGNKEWLMTLLYKANESSPSGLYTLSSTAFMPLFDSYRPDYMIGKPVPKATDYFKPKS